MTGSSRLLLDTHVILWWLTDDPELSDELKSMIDEEVEVYLSAASVWEVAIKQALGKIISPPDLPELMRDADLGLISIDVDHAIAAARLPRIHRDPFDRMLVAQARLLGLTLVTRDERIHEYDVAVLAA